MADYNLTNIRILLIEGFNGEELRRFCYDTPAFRPVYDDLAANSGKAEIVDHLIEYAERKDLFDPLLAWAAEKNPARYRQYQSSQGASTGPSGVPARADRPAGEDSGGASSSVRLGNVGGNIEGTTIAGRDVNIHHYPQAAPSTQATPAREEGQTPFWRQPTVWWASIVVALIALAGILIPLFFDNGANPTPAASFDYLVRVQAKDTGENISNAQVTIEVGGQAPLDTITDSNGVARISIHGDYAGKPGVLLVEAAGYERYRENMDLFKDALPDVVQLERAP